MRRSWRGSRGFRGNYFRKRGSSSAGCNDNSSVQNSTARTSSTAAFSRAPSSQVPIVIPLVYGTNNVWKLYLPSLG